MTFLFVVLTTIWIVGHFFIWGSCWNIINDYKVFKGKSQGSYYFEKRYSKEEAKSAQFWFKISLLTIWLAPVAIILIPVTLVGILVYGAYVTIKDMFGSLDDEDEKTVESD